MAPPRGARPARALGALALVLCALGAALAYGNSLDNEFALDDAHSIESNAWIRSLAHVPRYFVDASTFSTLRTNVDYRPLLQTSYAVNYALSGYDVRGWQLGQPRHPPRRLADGVLSRPAAVRNARRRSAARRRRGDGRRRGAGRGAAVRGAPDRLGLRRLHLGALELAHRGAAAAGRRAVPARAGAAARARRPTRARCCCSRSVSLTKVEAVSLLPVLLLADLLLDPAKQERPLVARLFSRSTWLRLWPFVVVTVAGLVLWSSRTGLAESATRAGATMTPAVYLLTQLRAWWYYVGLVVAPLDLVADYPSYPLSRSLLEPRVLLALAGWVVVVALALAAARRAPALTFLVLCFFLYLAPHSSVVPLAEPVNEHRPYLAMTGVFLLAALALAWRAVAAGRASAVWCWRSWSPSCCCRSSP